MKILCFVLLTVMYSITANAQTGDIQVIKDPRIDGLVSKQSKVTPPDIRPQIDGFRVQVFFDSDKSKVNAARSQVIAKFPKTDTYVTSNMPNFVLKVGDFRTRMEAERVKAELEAEFPTSFIVAEKVYLPRLQREDDEESK